MKNLLQHIARIRERQLEGDIKTAVPLGPNIYGYNYKVVVENIPERLLMETIIPGLEENDCVAKREEQEEAERQRKQAQARVEHFRRQARTIGDADETNSMYNL